MKSVKLYGELAEQFGPDLRLDVTCAAQAIRLMEANYPGEFVKKLSEGSFHVFITRNTTGEELDIGQNIEHGMHMHVGSDSTIHIMPVAEGAKNGKGFFSIILGIVLIAAAFVFPVAAGFAGLSEIAFAGITYGNIAMFGLAMVLGGIATLLTPTPSVDTSFGDEDQKQSFLFNGAVNTIEQGGPVPVAYGEVFCGSTVIAASVVVEKLPVTGDPEDDPSGKTAGNGIPIASQKPRKTFWARSQAYFEAAGITIPTPTVASPWQSPWTVTYTFNGTPKRYEAIELVYGGFYFTEQVTREESVAGTLVPAMERLRARIASHPNISASGSTSGPTNYVMTITSDYTEFGSTSTVRTV